MRIHFELTVEGRRLSRPRRPRTLVALGALALALVLPTVVLANHLFADVPTNHTFHTNITNLAGAGVTAGCGGGNYCPDQPVTRGQMAGFLNRGLGRVSEAEILATHTGKLTVSVVGSTTITPGTSAGAVPGAKQFVRAHFSGTMSFSDVTNCPCTLAIFLQDQHDEHLHLNFVQATVSAASILVPMSADGVIAVTGSSPVTIELRAYLFSGGGSSTQFTIYGNLNAETIPFGNSGTSVLGTTGAPAVPSELRVPTEH